MTLQQLQEFLDVEKWHESEARGYDMCGRYARCRYCDRFAENPCAIAHGKLIAVQAAGIEPIPDWLLPEPPINEDLVEEIAVADSAPEQEKSGRVRLLTITRKRLES